LLLLLLHRYQDILLNLRGPERRVVELVGVQEGYIYNRMQGKVNKRLLEGDKKVGCSCCLWDRGGASGANLWST